MSQWFENLSILTIGTIPIDFQDLCYHSEPKKKPTLNSLDKADPELIRKCDELQIPVSEHKGLANVDVDGVLDSVCIVITHRKELEKVGVIFCSISDAIREYPDLVSKYFGKVVPSDDNYYAALNSAVFIETGQFERTLIVADDRSFVEYLEGCTAPSYDRNQFHAAVIEL
ncbi:hypothetical protein TEA_008009 [Camellia sinensis var. sinensis]|uniref:SUF system FeS cluster assembly SufBD N-terminal domain-containing protein n=1 Tax=Camellia sinensis var. sinensis TaxID=542762 RepID=A0A4S4DSE6_CAMSN|nr:hypothetical protein TEA_008009 [Camellia sinensis var. sinensis]